VLARKLAGRTILAVDLRVPKLAASRLHRSLHSQARSWGQRVRGRKIMGLRRRAKYLIFDLDRGKLLVHLGMTGQLFAAAPGERPARGLPPLPDPHTHLILDLSGGLRLYYRDIRKFGRLRLLETAVEEARALEALGPEPLARGFTPAKLAEGLRNKKAPLKALLLNQKVVAGLGNIYVDEALFRAGLAPTARGGGLTRAHISRLRTAVRGVLREALRYRGTTLSDYFDPETRRGEFQNRLRVYGRAGQPCRQCGRPIVKAVVAQRGTHWCRHCQQDPCTGR